MADSIRYIPQMMQVTVLYSSPAETGEYAFLDMLETHKMMPLSEAQMEEYRYTTLHSDAYCMFIYQGRKVHVDYGTDGIIRYYIDLSEKAQLIEDWCAECTEIPRTAIWPNGSSCPADEVEQYRRTVGLSDDYMVVGAD